MSSRDVEQVLLLCDLCTVTFIDPDLLLSLHRRPQKFGTSLQASRLALQVNVRAHLKSDLAPSRVTLNAKMFKVPYYALLVAFLGPLVALAQVVPAGASEGIASIVPTVYSSAATLVSAQPTSTGAANAHGESRGDLDCRVEGMQLLT